MKNLSLTTLARTALAVAVLAPATACAKPAEQATSSTRVAAAPAPSTTLSIYVARHDRKLLADDADGDGKVSRVEFLAATKASKGDPAKRFAKLDRNSDGLLDKAEIDAMLTRRFKRQDTNGDGLLGADERAAVHVRKAKDAGNGPET